jgi:hypothetical protein
MGGLHDNVDGLGWPKKYGFALHLVQRAAGGATGQGRLSERPK